MFFFYRRDHFHHVIASFPVLGLSSCQCVCEKGVLTGHDLCYLNRDLNIIDF